ncbi:sulfate anion transporter [Vararia minispora EC-137]|uniref:Sulfate anion transporter n=1 Tax=Vararia minispora EC-137 TaxID=1314806 RepID=A0ACB8QDC1_9AGAM|nr:sulfate anion transporter [Vararia minispora EC-137]
MDPSSSAGPPHSAEQRDSHRHVLFSLPSFRSSHNNPIGIARVESEDENEPLLRRSAGESDVERRVPYGGSKKASIRAKAKYYIPSLDWIPNYSVSSLGGDVLAGFTVAAMLIPQSVSYATSLARLSPVTGLYSAAIPSIAYALLGTSRQLNVAPEAALSLIIGQTVSSIIHASPGDHPENSDALALVITSVIVVQVGIMSFVLGFFRLGFLDVVLSRALLRGFITAIAVVIAVEQFIPMLGLVALEHEVNPQTTLQKIGFLLKYGFTRFHRPTAILSFSAFLILVAVRNLKVYIKKWPILYRIPEVLVLVIVSTLLCDEFNWDEDGIDVLGVVNISTGKNFVAFPLRHSALKYVHQTTSAAVLISVIGFLDSIVAAKQNASRFGYTVSPNRELVALGAANFAASFVPGTLPAFGSITRSRINADVGGRTQFASIVCSALVLLATFFLLPALYYLPKCVLASIICMVVLSLLGETPEDIVFYWKTSSWVDMGLMILTFVLTIVWNVQTGVVVSVIISLLLVVRRSSRPRMTILGRIPGTETWKPINENPEAEEDLPGTLIVRIRENLDFANTAQLKERLRRLELYGTDPSHPSEQPRRQAARVLIFHMADMETCDASAIQILHELFEEYKSRDVDVYITHLHTGPRLAFKRGGIERLLGEGAFYQDVARAASRVQSVSRVASDVNVDGITGSR